MPLTPEFEATRRLTSTSKAVTDAASEDRSFFSTGRRMASLVAGHGQGKGPDPAVHENDARALPASTAEQLEDRWLLYLEAPYGDDDWHLFRIDLGAPEDPPVDLTPLPPGSRVFTVDPLVMVPGTVLVTMDRRSNHVDYFLVDVATGRTTADLPAGSADRSTGGADVVSDPLGSHVPSSPR